MISATATPSAAATASNAAVKDAGDLVDVVARVPTEWNQERALAGFQSAMQAHPDIDLVFTSSDFMLPSIKSVLSAAGPVEEGQTSQATSCSPGSTAIRRRTA